MITGNWYLTQESISRLGELATECESARQGLQWVVSEENRLLGWYPLVIITIAIIFIVMLMITLMEILLITPDYDYDLAGHCHHHSLTLCWYSVVSYYQ